MRLVTPPAPVKIRMLLLLFLSIQLVTGFSRSAKGEEEGLPSPVEFAPPPAPPLQPSEKEVSDFGGDAAEPLEDPIPSPEPPSGFELRHLVTSDIPTLTGLAYKYYGRASLWYEIAQWNSIRDPYWIYLGQTVVLRKPPKEGYETREPRSKKRPSVPHQQLAQTSDEFALGTAPQGPWYHIVNEETPTLTTAALLLYGVEDRATEIAVWNGLKVPFKLERGQKLVLKSRPIDPEKGSYALLQYWRRHFGLTGEPNIARSVASPSIAEPVLTEVLDEPSNVEPSEPLEDDLFEDPPPAPIDI